MGTPSVERPTVLAFGGNALLPDPFHPEEQEARARDLARAVEHLRARASGLVLVHGNGPQVGMILLRVDQTRDRIPAEPLDVLVAETQGSIGYLLARVLGNALRASGARADVTPILTQVVVDARDPAFAAPSKPVGAFYEEARAREMREQRGWHVVHEAGRGWRRVVPSPRPLEVVEMDVIRRATDDGAVVIAGGGGGIPVRLAEHGLEGVEAVIDKDHTAARLAIGLGAEPFVILTGVPHVCEQFGTPAERRLDQLPLADARRRIERGEFPAGSMGPKIAAACDYVEATGHTALITDTAHLEAALAGREGTAIGPTAVGHRDGGA